MASFFSLLFLTIFHVSIWGLPWDNVEFSYETEPVLKAQVSHLYETPTSSISLSTLEPSHVDTMLAATQQTLNFRISRDVTIYNVTTTNNQQSQAQVFGVVTNYIGKHQPITFLSIVEVNDSDILIKDTQILAYRETIGGEIRHPNFLKQFFNARPSSPLALGRDIDNITGATLSCRSTTWATQTSLALIKHIVHKEKEANL